MSESEFNYPQPELEEALVLHVLPVNLSQLKLALTSKRDEDLASWVCAVLKRDNLPNKFERAISKQTQCEAFRLQNLIGLVLSRLIFDNATAALTTIDTLSDALREYDLLVSNGANIETECARILSLISDDELAEHYIEHELQASPLVTSAIYTHRYRYCAKNNITFALNKAQIEVCENGRITNQPTNFT